ncbi:MAG: glycosyltransferase family 4 protein [Terriglobia bacterium]
MSTIAIDATYVVDPRPTGVSVYSRRLIESLAELSTPHHFRIGYRASRWRRRKEFIRFKNYGAGNRPAVSSCFFQNPWTFWLPWRAELFHRLAQRPAPFRFHKEVVTILDVFPLAGRGYTSASFERKFSALLIKASERSDRIITPSQYTADELVRLVGVSTDKMRVIPLGVDLPASAEPGFDPIFDPIRERERWVGKGNELVLVVGVIQTRKNTLGALRALERLPVNYRMVLVGGDGYGSKPVHDYIHKAMLGDRVKVLGYVGSSEVANLYRSASALFFPSFEEGYGLPVLEAMAYGLPVVASGTSSLPEVGGDAALYVDPHDEGDMAGKIRQAVEDLELRKQMIRKGMLHASEFTWRRVAEATLAVYDEVLAERH